MKFTITYPMHSHPYHPDFASGAGVVKLAKATEAAGFHGFGFTDHPASSQRWLDAGGHDALDPFVAMAFAAAHTSTIRLIPNIVVLPYRNPFVVAKSGATLDRLSEGRFTLAVGVGYLRKEFTAVGVDYEERAALFDEALEVIDAIWTGDDVSYEGRNFTANGITAHPRPLSSPRPPIWIGGNTGAARQRVVDRGEGWCPFAAPKALAKTAKTAAMDSVEALSTAIDDLRRRCDAAGRDASTLDIAFTNFEGGHPGSDAFNPDAHIAGLKALEALGVTWVHVHLPGDSIDHAVEAIDQFRAEIIDVM